MSKRLFLYIDILGFSELIKNNEKILQLYSLIDKARVHHDSNYNSIVFSDTLVAYNRNTNYTEEAKAIEIMYLIELTQDIFNRLIGTNIFFRAVITEGEFCHTKFDNLEAYFGEALVEAYLEEKKLEGTGLFLDRKLRTLNHVFRYKEFSSKFDYVYLTHMCSGLTSWLPRDVDAIDQPDFAAYPLSSDLLIHQGYEYMIYPELVHFQEIYENMNSHPNPKVRSKYLTTWNMYSLAYPGLIRALVNNSFDPNGISVLDWSKVKEMYEKEKAEPVA